MIVNQYEPITFEKMVLKDGTAYTMEKGSNDNGTWHDGDLRVVGRKLITIGINNANHGVHSSSSGDGSVCVGTAEGETDGIQQEGGDLEIKEPVKMKRPYTPTQKEIEDHLPHH